MNWNACFSAAFDKYAWQLSHLLQGSPFLGLAQFTAFASRRPVVVLPVPRGPEKR
jgi:hypothetical protein